MSGTLNIQHLVECVNLYVLIERVSGKCNDRVAFTNDSGKRKMLHRVYQRKILKLVKYGMWER